jgi:hypothetical protein
MPRQTKAAADRPAAQRPWMPDEADELLPDGPRPETDEGLLYFALSRHCGVGREGYVGPIALAEAFGLDPGLIESEVASRSTACVRDISELRGNRYPARTAIFWIISRAVPITIRPAVRREYAEHQRREAERPAREAAEAAAAAEKRRERAAFYRGHAATLELMVRLSTESLRPEEALQLAREPDSQ